MIVFLFIAIFALLDILVAVWIWRRIEDEAK
jgi:hypothetical protein